VCDIVSLVRSNRGAIPDRSLLPLCLGPMRLITPLVPGTGSAGTWYFVRKIGTKKWLEFLRKFDQNLRKIRKLV